MTSIEKLAQRLYKDLDINSNTSTFRRFRPGYWQRKTGAWSWSMSFSDRRDGITNQEIIDNIFSNQTVKP